MFRCYWIYKSHHLLRFLTKWYFKKQVSWRGEGRQTAIHNRTGYMYLINMKYLKYLKLWWHTHKVTFHLHNIREVVTFVVKHFWLSLKFGNQYIYQSLPRLLSLWLDYGASVVEAERKEKARQPPGTPQSKNLTNMKKSLSDLNEVIKARVLSALCCTLEIYW